MAEERTRENEWRVLRIENRRAAALMSAYFDIAGAVLRDESMWQTDCEDLNLALARFVELVKVLDLPPGERDVLLELREIVNDADPRLKGNEDD